MTKHFNRKTICSAIYSQMTQAECLSAMANTRTHVPEERLILTYSCRYCSQLLSRKDNLQRHELSCPKKGARSLVYSPPQTEHQVEGIYTTSEVKDMMTNITTEYIKKEAINQTTIKELRTQIDLLMQNQGSNITYNTNIVLNAFGNENTSYIGPGFIKSLVNSGPIHSISKLLKYIHFNPEHTENHNIQIPNKKNGYAKIYNGTGWQISDKNDAIAHMTDKAYTILNEHYVGANDYMNQFKRDYDGRDANLIKRLCKDTEVMILNHQVL